MERITIYHMMRWPCLSAREMLNVIYGSNEPKKKKRTEKNSRTLSPLAKWETSPMAKSHIGVFFFF